MTEPSSALIENGITGSVPFSPRAQADERVAALLGPTVDAARRSALQALVHKYIDSDDIAIDVRVVEFELPEAIAKILGKKPNDMYGEPTSGRRL
jgi:hypothetical protein